MEEWSLKLKLLHWMIIERADGVSPLICFDDDGGGDGGGGDGGGGDGAGGDGAGGDGAGGDGAGGDGAGGDGAGGGDGFDGTDGYSGGDIAGGDFFEGSTGDWGTFGGPESGTIEMSAVGSYSPDFTGMENPGGVPGGDPGGGFGGSDGLGGGFDTASGGFGAEGLGGDPGGGFGGGYGGDPGGGAGTGGGSAGGGGFESAGLDSGAGSQGGGAQDSQGGGGSGGLDIFDLPPIGRPPTPRELELEFEREFQQQQQQQQPMPPPPTFMPPTLVSGRVSQAPIAPGTLPSGAVANPFNNPLPDPLKDQGRVENREFPPPPVFDLPPRTGREGIAKEEEQKDSPFGQQTAFNPFGFNFNSPPDYNTAFSGMPGTPSAPPSGQQQTVDVGPPAPALGTAVQTQSITRAPTLADVVAARGAPGKGDREVREGRADPFGRDAQNPNIFDPNTFTPSVGMLMSNMQSMQPSQGWPSQGAQPFGPNMPTQGQQQVAQAPQQEQLTREQLDILTNPNLLQPYSPPPPPPQQGITPPAVASRTGREASPYDMPPGPVTGRDIKAPSPSQIIDTGARGQPPWSTVPAPTVNAPPANPPSTAFAPTAPPTPSIGGVPLGDLPGGFPSSGAVGGVQDSQGGGGSGVVTLPPQQPARQQQLSAQRRKLNQTEQERRVAITEALMRRDLFAPGVSDFDRLRLQP